MTFTLVHKSSNATLSCVQGKILTKGEHNMATAKKGGAKKGGAKKGGAKKGGKKKR
jgi:hypothetical protein